MYLQKCPKILNLEHCWSKEDIVGMANSVDPIILLFLKQSGLDLYCLQGCVLGFTYIQHAFSDALLFEHICHRCVTFTYSLHEAIHKNCLL